MQKYDIDIERTAQQLVTVEAESLEDAKLLVEDMSTKQLDDCYHNDIRSLNFTDYHEVLNHDKQYTVNHSDVHRTGTHNK
jgi:hypothetical protein